MKFMTTLNDIRACSPCSDGWAKLLNTLGKTKADDEPLSLLTILDSNGLDDALWCARAFKGHDRDFRLFAVWGARQVQHLMTDPRSLNALDVAEQFASGLCDDSARAAARAAAWAAARERRTGTPHGPPHGPPKKSAYARWLRTASGLVRLRRSKAESEAGREAGAFWRMTASENRNPTLHLLWAAVLQHRRVWRADHNGGDVMSPYELLGLFGVACAVAAVFLLIFLEVFDA